MTEMHKLIILVKDKVHLLLGMETITALSAFFWLIIVFSWIVIGFYAASVAGSKGHDSFSWFAAGLFFGPLGLIAACGLSDVTMRRYIRLLAEKEGLLINEPTSNKAEGFRPLI
jgi:hypothetical protein